MGAPPTLRISPTTSAISALSMAMMTSAASNPRALAPGASLPRARLRVGLRVRAAMRRNDTPFSVHSGCKELVQRAVLFHRPEHLARGTREETCRKAMGAMCRGLCDRGTRAHAPNAIFLKRFDRRQTGHGHDIERHRLDRCRNRRHGVAIREPRNK